MRLPFRKKYHNWDEVISEVLTLEKHEDLQIEFSQIPSLPSYFEPRLGDEDGQMTDYGLALEDGTGIHVKVYDDYYKIHWDRKDPNYDPLGHLIYDSPKWIVIGAIGIDWLVFKGRYTKKVLNFLSS